MADDDDIAEPASPGRTGRFGRRRKSQEAADGTEAVESDGLGMQSERAPEAAPAKAKRTRRQMPESTKRLLFIVAGVFVLVGSVGGFYLTSDAFESRVPVLVATRNIAVGETVSSADVASELMVTGSVPHIPWTVEAPLFFEGTVALQPMPLGGLVRYDMVAQVDTVPEGDELVVEVPLDVSLVTETVFEGELVLLVDPGIAPAPGNPGRPRNVIRDFTLTSFDGSQMRLILPAQEWADWTALLDEVGGTLMVKDLGPRADIAATSESLDAVWQSQWSQAAAEVAVVAAAAAPTAGPGELEVIVSLDASLVPSGVAAGSLVLLVDPGAAPLGNNEGRPRRVIGTLELENFSGGQMQMFVGPEDWQYWRSLPEVLGAAPMVLPVPPGTDVEDMSERLDAVWDEEWRRQLGEATGPA
ncbi:SAF domain-containing protein [Candidatus Poriferisodalis sp.]|uniref:SAF domain-containing protein n=1 Tax=Candidatus Poriferisodalis sp. TaxID=3101277 RepID=UPI003C6F5F46